MALEYKLSYTAEEIDEKLGLVGQNKDNIDIANENIESLIGSVNAINENIEGLEVAVVNKADKDHAHDNYADVNHEHDYADVDHTHDNYAEKEHSHNDKYDAIGTAEAMLGEAKNYTDTVVSGKADLVHNHDESYDNLGAANEALNSAKSYTDNAVQEVKDDLLNGAGEAYDTLKELGDLIDDNVDAIEALETVAAGKADKEHTHDYAETNHTHPGLEVVSKEEPTGQSIGDCWLQVYGE